MGRGLIIVALCVACGTSPETVDAGLDAGVDVADAAVADVGTDVDNGAPSTTYPAFQPDMPQVVNSGGPLLTTPKLVPLYFADDDTAFTGKLTTFFTALPGSTYWTADVGEYGIGALTTTAPVQLTENGPGPTTDVAIKTWLAARITDTTLPAPDASTVYMLVYPTGTSVQYGAMASCTNFYGYHESFVYQAKNVAYAVMPRCTGFHKLTGVDAITAVATHEIVETVTDPYASQNAAAYFHVDDAHFAFEIALGGGSEVGDLCAGYDASIYTPTDIGFAVQRNWSNVAAKGYHDPCVPQPLVYFNSVAVMPDTTTIGARTGVKSVNIPVGASKTIEVDLFSEADTKGPWTVQTYDAATLNGTGPATLDFSWDRTSGQNGEKLHLTIKALAQSPNGIEGFLIKSHLGTHTTTWAGIVQN
jgi:hypothetical protein